MAELTATSLIRTFLAGDGKELAYVAHLPSANTPRREAILYLHGIESHAGWFERAARLLAAAGHPVFCLDRRGSGLNRENRGCESGHLPANADLIDDLHRAILQLRSEHGVESLLLTGLSWGGKYALTYDVRHPGEVAGLILITPGIKPKVEPSFCGKLKILRDAMLFPHCQHRVPIEPEMFTTIPESLAYIRNDPLRLHSVSAAFLWQSHRMDRLLEHDAHRHAPVLVFLAGGDRIIDNDATRLFFAKHPGRGVQIVEYADQTQSIQLDAPERLADEIVCWVKSLAQPC
jgi:alpha-beta hydrolase superfamily lysophospholipase